MGKKQKIVIQEKKRAFDGQMEKQRDFQINKTAQVPKTAKLSKKQKRKLRKQISNPNEKTQEEIMKHSPIQKSVEIQEEVANVSVQQGMSQNEENMIEISSEQIEGNYQNDIEFNSKGKQGFEALFDEQNNPASNKIKSISITTNSSNQGPSILHLYHTKKSAFYKMTSLNHEKVNLTHLNQTASISIIDQNLLKHGNQQHSCFFWLNGKIVPQQIQFMKSTVFKIIQAENLNKKSLNQVTKNKKKSIQNNYKEQIKLNIEKFLQPSTPNDTEQILEFLRDFEWKEDCLLASKENLILTQTHAPFQNIDPKVLASNNSLMILGKKNTGKSTLAEYLKNTNPKSICILDCDVGRSLTVSGCVSLLTEDENFSIWIGQFTPFNCIGKYVKAIEKLYHLYRQKYFSKKLIINTMGYLSGVGEMIIYQIYNLINPSEIIVLNSGEQQQGYDNLSNILHHIKAGTYLNKLLTLSSAQHNEKQLKIFNQKKINLNIQHVKNEHAQGKGIPIRFENLLTQRKNFKNIIELIHSIKNRELQKIQTLPLYQQDKLGNLSKVDSTLKSQSNMRIVLIGKLFQSQNSDQSSNSSQNLQLFRVFGIGYGFQGAIYFSQQQIENFLAPKIKLKQEKQQLSGILSEGVDFQKNFYLINELSLIDYELMHGDLPFILPIIKGMGSKGTRNNPSKNA